MFLFKKSIVCWHRDISQRPSTVGKFQNWSMYRGLWEHIGGHCSPPGSPTLCLFLLIFLPMQSTGAFTHIISFNLHVNPHMADISDFKDKEIETQRNLKIVQGYTPKQQNQKLKLQLFILKSKNIPSTFSNSQ